MVSAMDPVTHGLLGMAAAVCVAPRELRRQAAVAGFLAGEFPDLDVLLRSDTDPLFGLAMHRHFTHSLVMVPVIGVMMAWIVIAWQRWRGHATAVKPLVIAASVAAFSHALCDVWTSYGTRWFWPFSQQRVSWDLISVIDPLFTLPILPLVVMGIVKRSRVLMLAALGWSALYLSTCAWQNHRVMEAARAVADRRGHEVKRITVKPSFANIVVWRALYEADGHAYVLCFRAVGEPQLLGETQVALVRPEQFSQIAGDSVLAEDIRRFAHFSDDWLAWHPEQTNVLGDLRYAQRPDAISPLWGIIVDPTKPDQHTPFASFRRARDESWGALWQMIRHGK
jgi:inner membrane protein